MKEIQVYNLGKLPTAPLDHFYELQDDFKISDPDKNMKLQMLIITRGFKYAFKAWKDNDGKLWIIDAHQRKKALTELQKNGFNIPPIPYEPIQADNKREAVEEIAAYNSKFADQNPDTKLFEKYNIGTDTLDRFNVELNREEIDVHENDYMFNDPVEIEEDEAPDVDTDKIFTQAGDIWKLGHHKLSCLESTNIEDIAKLMDGRLADLVVTDPPYNINYTGKTKDSMRIHNDSMDDKAFYTFLLTVYKNLYKLMKDGASIYVFHSDTEGRNFRSAFNNSGLKLAQCLIWCKNAFTMGRQDYQWQHEPILYGWKPTGSHKWYGDFKQSTVIRWDKPLRNDIHPTMKPIGLLAKLIQNSSKENDIIVDIFSGSGATLMACDQTKRLCYANDKDPAYIDLTVKRYYKHKKDDNIILYRDGKEFKWDEIKEHFNGN